MRQDFEFEAPFVSCLLQSLDFEVQREIIENAWKARQSSAKLQWVNRRGIRQTVPCSYFGSTIETPSSSSASNVRSRSAIDVITTS
jgi:hypothetical protein